MPNNKYNSDKTSRDDIKVFTEDYNDLKKREDALRKREKDLLKKNKILQREISQFKKQAKAIVYNEVLKARKVHRASEFSIPYLMFTVRKKHRESSKDKDQKCRLECRNADLKRFKSEKTFINSKHKNAVKQKYNIKKVKRVQRSAPYIQDYSRSIFRACFCKPKYKQRCTVKQITTNFKNALLTCHTCFTNVLCLRCTCHDKYKEAIYFRNCRCILEGFSRHNAAAGDCFMPSFRNRSPFWFHRRIHKLNPACFEERTFKNGGCFLLIFMLFLLCLVYLA